MIMIFYEFRNRFSTY